MLQRGAPGASLNSIQGLDLHQKMFVLVQQEMFYYWWLEELTLNQDYILLILRVIKNSTRVIL